MVTLCSANNGIHNPFVDAVRQLSVLHKQTTCQPPNYSGGNVGGNANPSIRDYITSWMSPIRCWRQRYGLEDPRTFPKFMDSPLVLGRVLKLLGAEENRWPSSLGRLRR